MKSGFAEKQFFKFRKIVFSAHAWTASNPCKINMWVDMGTWSIVFPKNLKKTEALRKDNFSSSEKLFYSHMLGMLPISTNWQIPAEIRTFDLQGWSPTRWTLRYRSILILWNSDKPGFAKKNQALKNCFFPHWSWNSDEPGFAKKNFPGSIFFCMPLVKSANSTSLPRLSSLQIVQMHAIHN